MRKLFKNMIPYWKTILIILLLLIVQVFCDLALPTYTADILDVGIQNRGVEHILPTKMTEEEYEYAKLFMTEEEAENWDDCYVKEGDVYTRVEMEKEALDALDEAFIVPVMLNYQMSVVDETTFKTYMASAQGVDVAMLEGLTIEQIGAQMGVELTTFEAERENAEGETALMTCVDMRPILAGMLQAGAADGAMVMEMRETLEEMTETMGTSLMKSTGIAYAIQCDERAGVDINQVQKSYLWKTGFIMIGFTAVSVACAIVVSFFASRIGAGVGKTLRSKAFAKVLSFSNTEMSQFSTASLITRTTNDVQLVQIVSAMMLRMVIYSPIMAIGGVIMVIGTGADMGWVIVLAVVVIMAFVFVLVGVTMPKFKIMQKLVDNINLVAREILTGLPVIRAFKREEREEERFETANMDLTKTQLFTNRVMSCMMPGMMVLMNCTVVLITWVAAGKIDEGVMQVGSMTAFITYAMMIIMSFLVLTMMSIMLPRAGVAAERIDEVIRTEVSIVEAREVKTITDKKGVLKFDHVDFRYEDGEEDVLTDIDFVAEPGKTTAIIGSTGSGKSTVVNLIPRLYDVTGGSITLDGVDIRALSLEELRDTIGYVPQKGVLFSGTIASNLRFGKAEATEEEIQEAAAIAQATEFIEAKQDRYDSPIAQGGTNVSGGQKQRLAIARAIAKDPYIYVFDDSFSALDLKTDAALRRALADKVQDKTVIIVAQRISTIMNAEQILVLDEGKLVGKGTHKELLHNCEVYLQIARSQLSEKELQMELEGKEEV
ncbi:MAG: ABC transporter ATP-binding protein [Eubacterium sp.]|nr:ABC transporter ATP-binding protein [Eubacterium sp.]